MDQGTANELAAAAPGSVTVGGTTYLASPPSDADWMALRKELRRLWELQASSALRAILDDLRDLPGHLQEAAVKAAVAAEKGGVDVSNDELTKQLHTPEGCRFLCWLLCRKNHPGLTLESLAEHVTADNALDTLAELLRAASLKDARPNGGGRTGSA